MPSPTDLLATSLCLLFSLWLWVRMRRTTPSRLPHPPGPRGLPLLGNLLDIPSPQGCPWVTYRLWSRQYDSNLIRISALGTNIVVVNSLKTVNDLLDKRSSIYSDRPRMVMLNELSGFDWAIAFRPYGDPWRDSRKMAHHEFHTSPVKRFRPNEERSTVKFLGNLHRQPDKLKDSIRYLAASTIMSIAYDIDVHNLQDPYIEIAEAAVVPIMQTMNAGSYLVDIVPILKHVPEWFPGAGFQKQAKLWRSAVYKSLNVPYEVVQHRLASGRLGDCAAKSLIEIYGKKHHTSDPAYIDHIIRSTLGSLYIGGADTTVSALGSFFLAMTLYPDIQKKARKELDQVVGSQRLPNFSDMPSLPYIEAIVKETLRWHPVVPLDAPHMLTQDDVYNGYYLPKGSLIVANSWAILHDEKMYPDPSTYNPDRFLRPDGTLDPAVRDPSDAAFGFGRRICPGRYMALDSMWIAIASVLAVFEIRKAVGADGQEITPDGEYIGGFLCHPKPFPCVIKPRSKESEALLMELAHQDEVMKEMITGTESVVAPNM